MTTKTSAASIIPSMVPLTPHSRKWRWVRAAAQSRLLAYGSILLLQLRVTWALWRHKNLEAGDTVDYFLRAWLWFERGQNDFA